MGLGCNKWNPPAEEAAKEFRSFSKELPEDELLSLYDNTKSELSIDSDNKAGFVAAKIIDAINNGKPFSMVRMGDGEGNVLFNYDNYPYLKKYILERISYIHFGDNTVVPNNSDNFKKMLETSIVSADVVCVPEREAISRGFHTIEEDLDVRAVVGNRLSVLRVANLLSDIQTTSSAWTNRHLLSHYRSIIGGRKNVGLISSYPELGNILENHFGIGEVTQHTIPKQAVFLKPSDRKNSGHYPDVFNNIVNSINPSYPGMPYLVSAGLLAKFYCYIIKQKGGVAIDAGSLPEIWLGIPNRGLSEDFINRWKIIKPLI